MVGGPGGGGGVPRGGGWAEGGGWGAATPSNAISQPSNVIN